MIYLDDEQWRIVSLHWQRAIKEMPEIKWETLLAAGDALLSSVRSKIGGHGKVQDWQERYFGSLLGYVAVRPQADTFVTTNQGKKYAVGYVTNAIEHGHSTRYRIQQDGRFSDRRRQAMVEGRYMYRDTQPEARALTQEVGEKIVRALVAKLEG